MEGITDSIGTKQWKEASKSWLLYAYIPDAYQSFSAEGISSHTTMLISETVLIRDWDSPEGDEAWADL